MQHWLREDSSAAPPIEVVEIERRTVDGVPISASEVRSLLAVDDFERIARLVPPATVALLRSHYRQKRFSTDETTRPMAIACPDREQQRMPNR
jgi:[citrate (pro-3S)-lyase] ligase